MGDRAGYENYPISTVVLRNATEIVLWGTGAIIMSGFGTMTGIAYLAYCIVMMVWIMRFRCKYCYYYGKTCSIGFGRAVPLMFEPGSSEEFPEKIKFIFPALLVWILPVLGGIYMLARDFSFHVLALLLLFVMVRFYASRMISVRLGCAYCRQSEICPAYRVKDGLKS